MLAVSYGDTILDFEAELDAPSQIKKAAIKSYGWDPAKQQLLESGAGSATALATPGNASADDMAKVFGIAEFAQRTGAPVDTAALEAWSGAELIKSSLAKIRGSVRFPGSALAKAGKTIELAKDGPRFNGTAYISGVHHHISEGAWTTTASFGLPPTWFASESHGIAAPGAAGQLPPVRGLQTGIVKQVHQDDTGNFRVLVKLPLMKADDKAVWARLATFYASSGFGAVFYPEVDDEVVVGFMNEDPRFPVILGSVYGKARAPAFPPDEKNDKKALTTRTKLQITFDEKDKIIEISTPGKHTLTMDDKVKGITIKDTAGNTVSLADKGVITIKTPGGHSIAMDDQGKEVKIKDSAGNTLTMASGGVTLESASNLTLSAKGNVSVKATGNIALAATGKATMEGLEITHTAKTKFSAQGNAAAEVKASGMLTLQGGLVKIN